MTLVQWNDTLEDGREVYSFRGPWLFGSFQFTEFCGKSWQIGSFVRDVVEHLYFVCTSFSFDSSLDGPKSLTFCSSEVSRDSNDSECATGTESSTETQKPQELH
jgi:hypothetical protein